MNASGVVTSVASFASTIFRIPLDVAPFVLVFLTFVLVRQHVQRRRMPPGPRGLPFIGNKHQVPSIKPWRKFAEWNKQYGAFMLLDAGVGNGANVRSRPGGVPVPG